MTETNEILGIDCEEMLLEEYNSDESIIIYNSDFDEDNISDSELSNDYELDVDVENIFDLEERFLDSEMTSGKYYIGLPCLMRIEKEWIMQIPIQPSTMFSNNINAVMRYLISYSVTPIRKPIIHIMQLDISNRGSYNVVLKTFWIKIIQRCWRRVFKERKEFLNKCKNPIALLHRQKCGKWNQSKKFPTLRGMFYKN